MCKLEKGVVTMICVRERDKKGDPVRCRCPILGCDVQIGKGYGLRSGSRSPNSNKLQTVPKETTKFR
uniref:Uncharacterized protein n=1 Tax=Nelumbo nucifera TaxID=4432 RepID=A0A822Y3C8_NELNU|nr:TPA_asm: hypothetical protein HUJ06_028395 [Nelumbo nucifera]